MSTAAFISTLLTQKPKSLNQLKQIHALIITTGLNKNSTFQLSKLIQHYFHYQTPTYAHLIVNQQTQNQTFLYNTLLKCNSPVNSISLFANWVSLPPFIFDDHTFIFALGACARSPSLGALYEGKQIHSLSLKLGFMMDVLVATTAIHFYASKGVISFSKKVFDEMPKRSNVTWNALITGYSSQKFNSYENAFKAVLCFKDMLVDEFDVRPNGKTMVGVLSAVSKLGLLEVGSCVHGFIAKIVDAPVNDVFIGTGLIDMYAKCGCLSVAIKVFAMMKETNVLSWTSMATGLAFHGKGKEAIELLREMLRRSTKPNVVTFTCLLSACCHSGLVEEGLQLFREMEEEFGVCPQMEHYGCMVDLLGKAGHLREAFDLIQGMPGDANPVLWRSLLGSCRVHGDVMMGEEVGKILLELQSDVNVVDVRGFSGSRDHIALSNVYALANRWDDVGTLRGEMKNKGLDIQPGRSVVN